MKKYIVRVSVAVVMALAAVLFIGGCSSQSDLMALVPEGVGNTDQDLADDERLDTGNPDIVSTAPDEERLDIAQYFFTEADRQWFCSVTTPVSVFTDQLYAERFGNAWFERFGLVDWRRHDELDQLEIETVTGETFSLREIFASNTILEFQRHNAESAESDLYECVLTTRDIGSL